MAATVAQLFSKIQIVFRNPRQRWNSSLFRTTTRSLPSPLTIRHHHFLSPPLIPPSLPRRRFSTTMSDPGQLKTVRVEIKGRVQGVFYRNWTVENAKELGLNGWVRNRKDGSVEALFSGSTDKVDEMQQRCRRGPNSAVVTSLQSFPSHEDPGSGFNRIPTV